MTLSLGSPAGVGHDTDRTPVDRALDPCRVGDRLYLVPGGLQRPRRGPRRDYGEDEARRRSADPDARPADRVPGIGPLGDREAAVATLPDDDPVGPPVDPGLWLVHVRFARRRDPEDLRFLVQHYLPLADAVARRFPGGSASSDDLGQVAYEALVGAVHRFDPARRIPFPGFAVMTIEGSLKRFLRDTRWSLHLPRRCRELSSPVRRATELLEQDLGRTPTAAELGDWLGLSVDVVLDTQQAERRANLRSLDELMADGVGHQRTDMAVRDHELDRAEDRRALEQMLAVVTDEDRRLLDLYYGQERSQSEIAAVLGVSQMQVSRELRRVMARLRSHLQPA